MKRFLAFIIALLLTLAVFTACAGEEDIGGEIVTSDEAQEGTLSFGEFEGNIYTNKYLGLGCKLDENWEFSSAYELQEITEETLEMLEGTEAGNSASNMQQIMDMQADNMTEQCTINIGLAKIELVNQLAFNSASEEDIVDASIAEAEMMQEAYAQIGLVDLVIDKIKVDFAGEEHFAIKTSGVQNGVSVYMLQVMDYSKGSYGATVTMTSFGEDKTLELADLFYTL